uniref:Uncharacterized protein n=1 Tax=Anguilla anguilla TaxID=7936 RepID=A0A0E9UBI3_ANGAN
MVAPHNKKQAQPTKAHGPQPRELITHLLLLKW